MAISRAHTWSAGEVLLAADLNAEFNNVLNNAADLVSPFTKAISMGGFSLNFDAANTMSLTSSTKGLNLSSTTAINDVFTTVASATTPDIWTAVGGVVNYTGTTTATGFASAPQAGARRTLVCAGAAPFTAGANMLIDGLDSGATYTAVAGDKFHVIAVTTTQFRISPAFVSAGAPRFPININPNWLLDQINEGALYTVSAGTTQGPDGWTGSATGAGVFKLRTLADPDNAALKCLEITCTTADAAIATGDNYYIKTALEGYDVADLKAGTASASQITIQFKAKSNSVTGVFGVAVQNSAANRRYIGTITVPDTAENSYSVTLTLDTSGTWLYTNGSGLVLILTLAAGSTFQGTAGAWAAGAEQTTSAQANFMSANTNILYLKRIHVIPGGVALAYSSQDIQRELAKAQRQYEKSFNSGVAVAQNTGVSTGELRFNPGVNGGNVPYYTPYFRVSKRAVPTCTLYNTSAANAQVRNITTSTDCSGSGITQAGTELFTLSTTIDAGGGVNSQLAVHYTANARLS